MSETAATTATRTDRRAHRDHVNGTTAHTPDVAKPEAAHAVVDKGETTFELKSGKITVPNKFAAGDVLTATQATILMAAYVRQFINNENANAEARAKRYAAAKTDEDRAANAPLTVDQLVEKFLTYEPAVGGAPRVGSAEKLRLEAAKRAWAAMVTEHNKAVQTGGPAVIPRAVDAEGKPFNVTIAKAPVKTKDMTEEEHKAAVQAFEERQASLFNRLLTDPRYAERVQIAMDAILAERGAKQPAGTATKQASIDLL